MDAYEARLTDDIARTRAELVTKAENLKRAVTESAEVMKQSLVETFDPRERVKRNPVSGLLTSLGAGMFLGRMMPGRSGRGNDAVPSPPPPVDSSFASIAMGLLPSVLPTVLPGLIGPLLSLIMPRPRKPKPPNGH